MSNGKDPYVIERKVPYWDKLGAACIRDDVRPELFDNDEELLDGSRSKLKLNDAAAKAICARCPAICHETCFEYHMDLPQTRDYGIRAGLDREERLAIRSRLKAYANAS